jgi:hypothetical protein
MKREPGFVVPHVDATELKVRGMKVAVVGGTGGTGGVFSRFLAAQGASPELEGLTGALVDRKSHAIVPLPAIAAGHVQSFATASAAPLCRTSPGAA